MLEKKKRTVWNCAHFVNGSCHDTLDYSGFVELCKSFECNPTFPFFLDFLTAFSWSKFCRSVASLETKPVVLPWNVDYIFAPYSLVHDLEFTFTFNFTEDVMFSATATLADKFQPSWIRSTFHGSGVVAEEDVVSSFLFWNCRACRTSNHRLPFWLETATAARKSYNFIQSLFVPRSVSPTVPFLFPKLVDRPSWCRCRRLSRYHSLPKLILLF